MTLAAVGCGGGGSGGKPAGAPTMKVVGTSGGAVTSSDGNLAVNIPAGALPSNVTITTEPAEAPATGAVGTVYEIGPTGTQFAMPVTLTLHYDAAALSGASESSLRVATYAAGAWQLLPGAMIDTQAKTVSGVTTHLSPYAIVTEAVGKTCATVQPGWGCAAGGADAGAPIGAGASSGGMSAGGTSTGDPAPGSGGTSMTCDPPTCAGATNVCGQYPGATMDSCTDSPKGYSAACCFPSNAPICFAIGGAGAACAGSTGTGGGGSTCPPPPTCASATAATACAGYPGATLQNCTDATNGFTGACCFAPEARVCVKAGAGRACAGSSAGGSAGGCSTPPPRCADGNPCAGFVGATADSCTDTTDGFEATCCFAAGTLPIATGGGSSAGGSADGGVPASDAGIGGGGPDGGTGGPDGGAPPPCVAGGSCTPGYKCDPGSSTSCTVCMCGADGHLTCGPCGSGTGATGGGTGGAGGSTGTTTCAPGAPCTQGSKCGGDVAGACMDCMCGADGHLTCAPCGGGTGATGGTTGAGGSTGTTTCAPGAACTAGSKCGGDVAGACMDCMCAASGTLVCAPCGGGTGATGGTTGAGGSTGTMACAPGATCTPGFKCDPGSAAGCMVCMCGADGFLACGPCGGTGATGGTTGAGGTTGGPASGPCQVNMMPAADVGQPCSVMEVCPDGTDYRVRCDGNGACMCFVKGAPTSTMPALSCSGLVPSVALMACGFPDGKI